ncbi:hypothetical protein ACM9XD_04585 [Xanthomonas sacchari]
MESKDFESVKALLLSINEIVAQMDPSVRVSTFDLLTSRFLEQSKVAPAESRKADSSKSQDTPDTTDLGTFISSFDTSKPSEAVMVLVAWLYSNYGVYPISAKEIKELADSCGLTVPNRSDNTMRGAKNNNKALFTQQSKGWQLTVSGEIYMKDTYKVKKGNTPLPSNS